MCLRLVPATRSDADRYRAVNEVLLSSDHSPVSCVFELQPEDCRTEPHYSKMTVSNRPLCLGERHAGAIALCVCVCVCVCVPNPLSRSLVGSTLSLLSGNLLRSVRFAAVTAEARTVQSGAEAAAPHSDGREHLSARGTSGRWSVFCALLFALTDCFGCARLRLPPSSLPPLR